MRITIEEYIEKPCSTLSIPYWKNKKNSIPDNLMILHHDSFEESYLDAYSDERYFRLYHSMQSIKESIPDWMYFKTAEMQDMCLIVSIINQSYTDIQVDLSQIVEYTKNAVYDPNLWIIAIERATDKPIGCGLADYDDEVKEGSLEWIQVLPQYRNRSVGSAIVNQLLYRLSHKARFTTVSGKIDSFSNPERLYRKCGFAGNDVWHILRLK